MQLGVTKDAPNSAVHILTLHRTAGQQCESLPRRGRSDKAAITLRDHFVFRNDPVGFGVSLNLGNERAILCEVAALVFELACGLGRRLFSENTKEKNDWTHDFLSLARIFTMRLAATQRMAAVSYYQTLLRK